MTATNSAAEPAKRSSCELQYVTGFFTGCDSLFRVCCHAGSTACGQAGVCMDYSRHGACRCALLFADQARAGRTLRDRPLFFKRQESDVNLPAESRPAAIKILYKTLCCNSIAIGPGFVATGTDIAQYGLCEPLILAVRLTTRPDGVVAEGIRDLSLLPREENYGPGASGVARKTRREQRFTSGSA